MSIKQVISIALLITLLVLTGVQVEGNLTYEEGYEDGVRAAKEDVKELDSYVSTNLLDAKPPPHRMENIADKPKPYREGFLEGYKITYRKVGPTSPNRNLYWTSATLILLLLAGGISLGIFWALS